MRKELDRWRSENEQLGQKMRREQKYALTHFRYFASAFDSALRVRKGSLFTLHCSRHSRIIRRQTDTTVEPLRAQLTEFEQRIVDQQEQIAGVKARIAANDERIHRMLTGASANAAPVAASTSRPTAT